MLVFGPLEFIPGPPSPSTQDELSQELWRQSELPVLKGWLLNNLY